MLIAFQFLILILSLMGLMVRPFTVFYFSVGGGKGCNMPILAGAKSEIK
jgi:hypothetical protein